MARTTTFERGPDRFLAATIAPFDRRITFGYDDAGRPNNTTVHDGTSAAVTISQTN